ncbi:MAG TPA: bifunctional YncE family protein/alkaline phosphatase family protein [Fimbriimonas sp.]
MTRKLASIFLASTLAVGAVGTVYVQARRLIGVQSDGSVLVSTGQALTPAGTATLFEGQRPKDLAVSPDGRHVAVLAHRRLFVLGTKDEFRTELAIVAGPLGVAWSPDGTKVYASASGGKVVVAELSESALTKSKEIAVDGVVGGEKKLRSDPHLAGLAVSPDGHRLFVAMTTRNAVAVVRLGEDTLESVIPVGVAPYHVALDSGGRTLAVSNRGGRRVVPPSDQMDPTDRQPFEGVGVATQDSAGTLVQIDPVTDAAWSGSVTLVDTASLQTREVSVGRQPSGLAFSGDGSRLYVAESDSDSVSFVDVRGGRVEGNLSVRPAEEPQFGQIPTDLVPSEDGRWLYVSLGGVNAVAAVELAASPRVAGYLPTGWYPAAVGMSDGSLLIGSSKGVGSRPASKQSGFGVHDSVGMLQRLAPADFRDLKEMTRRVASNNRWNETLAARSNRTARPIPQRLGEPSTFRHVVYIIKENLTYDSTLGDVKEGNGDPSLCTFPEEVTPNHHALAREFVLLDNFYTSGTNSADGHQWTSSSVANGYVEQNYSSNARSYPYDGGDALANSPEGFLWTAARRAGRSVRVFGEFVNRPRIVNPATGKAPTFLEAWEDYKSGTNSIVIEAETDNAALRPHLHPHYIGFPSIISDQWRADQFLGDLAKWEQTGWMPSLSILLLPNNHTAGTSPGMPTPRAAVADNDLALGRIVEGISKSRFWKDTLILVVEDDSQTGVDHVDGHRSVAFCISPYTKRGAVVSEMYNHTSFVRTLGLVLGVPPMNRFDRNGMPLTACFNDRPDLRTYTARPNNIPLDQMNPDPKTLKGVQRELAIACENLDWSDVDRTHAMTVAKAVWYSVKPKVPFPERYYAVPDDQE